MLGFVDRIKLLTSTTGTGTLTLTTAVTQYRTAVAGLDGLAVEYIILDVNGTAWETGIGVYTHSGTTLTRGKLDSSTGSAISLSATGSTVILGAIAQTQAGNYYANRSHIDGGQMTLPSSTTLNIGAMTAFVESLNCVCTGPAPVSAITPTLSANAIRYIYASFTGGVWVLSDSATGPVAFATPAGNARSMSGDASKRFIGSIYANSGATAILPFTHADMGGGNSTIYYIVPTGAAPYRVLNGGTSTSFASIDLSGIVPPAIGYEVLLTATGGYGTTGGAVCIMDLSVDATNILTRLSNYIPVAGTNVGITDIE
jgi:hypothetical protein